MYYPLLFVTILCCLCSFTSPATVAATYGVGIDIIQGKNSSAVTVTGNQCGSTRILIHNEEGDLVALSPVFEGTGFNWNLPTNLDGGTYEVHIHAENASCSLSKTLTWK